MRRLKLLGQSLTELALLIATVTAAILGMQLYVQRALQARYKGGMDYFFNDVQQRTGVSMDRQYQPYYWQSKRSVATSSNAVGGYPDSGENSVTTQRGWSSSGSAENAD